MIDGTAHASDVVVAGIEIARLNATATQKESTTNFSADAQLRNGASVAVGGALSPLDGGYRVRLDTADLKQGALAARLTAPSTIQVQGQDIAIDNLLLDVGGGQVGVRGTVAEKLNLAVSIKALPLAIANAIRPDLALGGTIDGSAAITGTRSRARYRIRSEGAGDCCRGPSPGRPRARSTSTPREPRTPRSLPSMPLSSAPKGCGQPPPAQFRSTAERWRSTST